MVGRITPSQKTWARVPAPADGANAHIAVGPDGSVTTAEWVVSTTTPTDQKLNVYTLPANSSTFSPATTLYSLAAPFIGLNGGFTLAGNGQGAYVAGWTVWTGVSAQTQAFASYSSNGTTWTAPEMVGAAPSTLGVVAVDPSGNALATYSAGTLVRLQSVYRSYLDDTWRVAHARPDRCRRDRLRPGRQRRARRPIG